MRIPSTKSHHELKHKSGATVIVRQLGRFELGRLQAFTRFSEEDVHSHTRFMIYASKACIVSVIGNKELAGVKSEHHADLDLRLMPDEVAEFALEDDNVQSEIVRLLAASSLGRDYVPNSSGQPAGSGNVPSGLPQIESTPKT